MKVNLSITRPALALLRVSLGMLAFLFTCVLALEFRYFLLDTGPAPRAEVLACVAASGWGPSIHILNGNPFYLTLLLLVQAGAALALVVNRRPALAAAVSWFMLVSISQRAPFLLHSSVQLLSVYLLWAIFLPWNPVAPGAAPAAVAAEPPSPTAEAPPESDAASEGTDPKEATESSPPPPAAGPSSPVAAESRSQTHTTTFATTVFILQVWATAWLTGYLRVADDSPMAWVGLLGSFLVFAPGVASRWLAVLALAVLHASQMNSTEPTFALISLAGVVALAPLGRSTGASGPEPSGPAVIALTALVTLSAAATVSGLSGGRLPGELGQMAEGLGLAQAWRPEAPTGRFATKVTFSDHILYFQDGAHWRDALHARFLSSLGDAPMVSLQTSYFNYVGRTMAEQRLTGRVDRVELLRLSGLQGENVVATWLAPPRGR